MESAEWHRVKVLFDEALKREPNQRSAFLDEACAGNAGLCAEVVSLLASFEGAGNFIEPPRPDRTPEHPPERPVENMRTRRVGPYQLLRQIGHGGMGTVYLATRADEQYQKRVAVKVVRAGLETREIVRRVQQERQMLAALDHPNIVKLLDGGTTDEGLPFLVMDYVEGTPIDQYCDVHRLSTTERLQLFLNVCAAVQYAHQNLLVHRDLKPSNIVVTPTGVPKLLDFGIAKLLRPEFSPVAAAVTQTAERPMTLEYASPEQIRGEPITTSTDVYALGVMLYELLTGHSPYRVKTFAPLELERAVCDQEPEKPSTAVTRTEEREGLDGAAARPLPLKVISESREGTPEKLQKRLSGDLDMIVLMALRKEPQRRYASVEQFAEDLRRHLTGLPVRARKDTVGYRTSKFLTRHKVGVSAAALVVLTLLAGIVSTSWEAAVARRERARAERRFNDVRNLANAFLFDFYNAIRDLPGSIPARKLVVQKALEYLDSLAREAPGDPSVALEVATAYTRVAEVQGYQDVANLGDSLGALENFRKGLTLLKQISATDAKNADVHTNLARTYAQIGRVLSRRGDKTEALASFRSSLQELASVQPERAQRLLIVTYIDTGAVQTQTGDYFGALDSLREAVRLAKAQDQRIPLHRSYVAFAVGSVGLVQGRVGDTVSASEGFQESVRIHESVVSEDPTNALFSRSLATAYLELAELYEEETGQLTEALETLRKAVAIEQKLQDADPQDARAPDILAECYSRMCDVLDKSGDQVNAIESCRKAERFIAEIIRAGHADDDLRLELSKALSFHARILRTSGAPKDAHGLVTQALDIQKALADEKEAIPDYLDNYAKTLLIFDLADSRSQLLAMPLAQRAVEMTRATDPHYLDTLALAYFENGNLQRAVETEEKALALLPPLVAGEHVSAFRRDLEAHRAQFRGSLGGSASKAQVVK
jgi:serine/threonine protein kinase